MDPPPVALVVVCSPCFQEDVSSVTFNASDQASNRLSKGTKNGADDAVVAGTNDDDTLVLAQNYIFQKIQRARAAEKYRTAEKYRVAEKYNSEKNRKTHGIEQKKASTRSDEVDLYRLIADKDLMKQQKRILDEIHAKRNNFVPKEIEIPVVISCAATPAKANEKSSNRQQRLKEGPVNVAFMNHHLSDSSSQLSSQRKVRVSPKELTLRPIPRCISQPARQKRLTDSS